MENLNAEFAHVAATLSITSQFWTLESAGIVYIRGVPNAVPIVPSPHSYTTGVPRHTGRSLNADQLLAGTFRTSP